MGTGKLHRRNLEQIYKSDIDAAYARVAAQAEDALSSLAQDQTFTAQGGSSLQASRIASSYIRLGIPMPRIARLLLEGEHTVAQVRSKLSEEASAHGVNPEEVDELKDALLPDDIRPAPGMYKSTYDKILVTGCTGFIGRFLVAHLLATGKQVVCLVRANSKTAGMERMVHAMDSVHMWDPRYSERLEVVCGDCSSPRFCLPESDDPAEAYNALVASVGMVVHLAAKVNLVGSYAEHRQINVAGTLSVLRFGALAGAGVVFISTTDAWQRWAPDGSWAGKAVESLDLPPPDIENLKAHKGYATSKWVGERLAEAAHQRGLRVCIARLGMIVGDTKTGMCNPKDIYCRLLVGFAQTKAFPECRDSRMVRSLSVDSAVLALASLVDFRGSGKAILIGSLAEPLLMTELREQLLRFGDPYKESGLPIMPFQEWLKPAETQASLSVWPLLSSGWAKDHEFFPSYDRSGLVPGYREALAETLGEDVASKLAQGVSEECLHAMLRFLFRCWSTAWMAFRSDQENGGACAPYSQVRVLQSSMPSFRLAE